jgi:predicted nucleic acid-binding Zn ribbon protein
VNRRDEHVGSVIERTLKRLKLWQRLRESDAVQVFSEAVGEVVAKQAEAVSIDNGKLIVRVPSATWRQHLRFEQQEMIDNVNAKLGSNVVREIFFTR